MFAASVQSRAIHSKKLAADGLSPYRISAALADSGVKLSHVTPSARLSQAAPALPDAAG